MSFIEPPTSTNLLKRKRKESGHGSRASSTAASHRSTSAGGLLRGVINPHSHRPKTLKQLRIAGLTHSDRLPSRDSDFPHRPLSSDDEDGGVGQGGGEGDEVDDYGVGSLASSDEDNLSQLEDDETADESVLSHGDASTKDRSKDKSKVKNKNKDAERGKPDESEVEKDARRRAARRHRHLLRLNRAYDRHIGVLLATVQRGLQEADHGMASVGVGAAGRDMVGLARARRAFGLLLRTDVNGRAVDLRRDHLWALGAELLMREGEEEDVDRTMADQKKKRRRWGSAANLDRVRIYYEDLIHLFPYDRKRPTAVSALTFWPALVSTELYSIYTEERLVAQHAGEDDHGDGNSLADDQPGDLEDDREDDRERQTAREAARLTAQSQIRDLARRLDVALASGVPFSTSHELLRLRAMIALYAGDLAVVTSPRTEQEAAHGRQQQAKEHKRARIWMARIVRKSQQSSGSMDATSRQAGITTDAVVDTYLAEMSRDHDGDDNEEEEEDEEDEGEEEEEEEEEVGEVGEDDDDDDSDNDDRPSFTSRPMFSSIPIRH